MAIQKLTIKRQIENIVNGQKLDTDTGFLYRNKTQLRRKSDTITMFGLFVSDGGTFMVRPHVFTNEKGKTPTQWESWLRVHYGTILRDTILPGMELRNGKAWRLYRVIGISHDDHSGLTSAKARSARNKTKSQRRQNGCNRARRR